MARHGVELLTHPQWLVDDNLGQVALAVEWFLKAQTSATALLMNNDENAMVALSVLEAHGYSVSADFSVVGDDDIPLASFCRPALATVSGPDPEQISLAAFDMLSALIKDPNAQVSRQVFKRTYIPRESVGVARIVADGATHIATHISTHTSGSQP